MVEKAGCVLSMRNFNRGRHGGGGRSQGKARQKVRANPGPTKQEAADGRTGLCLGESV